MIRIALCTALACVGLSIFTGESYAQRNAGLRTARSILSRPTVSPYLNLLQPQGYGLPNYQTIVRPMIDQRARNQETARQLSSLQSAVVENNVRDQRGEVMFRPTGHATGTFYYSHFYPLLSQRRR